MSERLYEVTLRHDGMKGESVNYFVKANHAGAAEIAAKNLAVHDYCKEDHPTLFYAYTIQVLTSDMRGLP